MLSVRQLTKIYEVKKSFFSLKPTLVVALSNVSFDLSPYETLGVVGESGSGKSTLARCILLLERPDSGEIIFKGKNILGLKKDEVKALRKEIQIVFQDPYSSLNPRMRVKEIISEPIRSFNLGRENDLRDSVTRLLSAVGLDETFLNKYPHEMSGGQRQRVAIARALSVKPSLLVADEPLSSLDVSVQAQILSLFLKIKETERLSIIFISHDLNVVRFISERIMVMYRGHVVELGSSEEIFSEPLHPYTRMLLSESPSLIRIPKNDWKGSGCPYKERCEMKTERCESETPGLFGKETHRVACFLYETCYN